MKIVPAFCLLFLSAVALSGCSLNERWQGFYYPDGCLVCEDKYVYSPQFDDRASCISWAKNLKQQRNNPDDDFECGKNCKAPDRVGGLYVCDETVDTN